MSKLLLANSIKATVQLCKAHAGKDRVHTSGMPAAVYCAVPVALHLNGGPERSKVEFFGSSKAVR